MEAGWRRPVEKWVFVPCTPKTDLASVTSQFLPALLFATFFSTIPHPLTSSSSSPALQTQALFSLLKEGPSSPSEVFTTLWCSYTPVDISHDLFLMSLIVHSVGSRGMKGMKENNRESDIYYPYSFLCHENTLPSPAAFNHMALTFLPAHRGRGKFPG